MPRKHDDAHRPLQGRGQRGNRTVVPANWGGAELVTHEVAPLPGLTLDALEVRFLAARLRRLFSHFGVAVPDGGIDAHVIGAAASGIGLLLMGREADDVAQLKAALRSTLWVLEHPEVNALHFAGNPRGVATRIRELLGEEAGSAVPDGVGGDHGR